MVIAHGAVAGSLESSDAMVTVSPGEELRLEIESVVLKQFGPAIEAAVRQVLGEQGVDKGHIQVRDRGALECTIKARVETALLRGAAVAP